MSNSHSLMYGLDTATGKYKPLEINSSGHMEVELSNSSLAITNSNLDALTLDSGNLNVKLADPLTVDVALSNANDDVLVYAWDGASNQKVSCDAQGQLQIDVLTQPALASGTDSVDAVQSGNWSIRLQDGSGNNINSTGNNLLVSDSLSQGSLSSIDGKLGVSQTGSHANMDNATVVIADQNSTAVDVSGHPLVSIVGNHSNTADNIHVQASYDGTNYYTIASLFPNLDGDFSWSGETALSYVRLEYVGAGTVTSTCIGKKW